jgi:hypothetical protein
MNKTMIFYAISGVIMGIALFLFFKIGSSGFSVGYF